MDNSKDKYKFFSENYVTSSHPTYFLWNINWRKKIVFTDSFFEVTNIRTNMQNDSSDFEGLLQKMVYKKPFMNQEMGYINDNVEGKLCTVSAYIKYYLCII